MSRSKWIALVALAVLAATVLAACGSSSSSTSGSTEAAKSSEGGESEGSSSADLASFEKIVKQYEEPITEWPAEMPSNPVKKIEPNKLIVSISLSPEEAGGLAIAEGVVEAAKEIGWKSKILYGYGQASKTNAAFEQAIALGADIVTSQGINPETFKGAINKLHEAGAIYVSCCSDVPPSEDLAQAEPNDHSALSGEIAAAKAVVESGGEGKFALFNFPEYAVLQHRLGAAKETFEKCSGCEIVEEVDTNPAEAEKTMPSATSTLLQKNPDLTGIVTGIDNMVTNFQLPILRQQGSEASVYTFLGGGPTLEAVEKGEVSAVVVEPLVWEGWQIVDMSARLLAGEKVTGEGLPLHLITEENVQEELKTAAPNGFYDANGFDYRSKYKELWGKG